MRFVPALMHSVVCAALFRGKRCEFEKSKPECLRRTFSGAWISLHAGVATASDPWLKSLEYSGTNESRDLLNLLPPRDAMNHTAPFNSRRASTSHSCALVGSSAELIGSDLGSKIDEHDIVVRLNRAPVKGFEHDVGSFTTLRYTNNFNEGFREVDSEAVLSSKWCSTGPPCDFHEAIARLGGKKVHALSPAFVAYAKRDTFAADVGHNPSSGFTATLLLLHMCNSVDIYGFSVFLNERPSMKRWYYNHDHRPSPRAVEFDTSDVGTMPVERLRANQHKEKPLLGSALFVGKKATSTVKVQTAPQTWPTYDKLWWSVYKWLYVLPNADPVYSAVDRQTSSDNDVTAKYASSQISSSSPKGAHGGPARNILAQSTYIGHEKRCLRSLHAYGLISATDGST